MSEKRTHQNAVFKVCVDSTVPGIQGRVYGLHLCRPILFSDMGSFLIQVGRLMDSQNFPQAFQRTRSFQNKQTKCPDAVLPEGGMTQAQVEGAQGEITAFWLYIFSRRSATWQGKVVWPGEKPVEFFSDLELLSLVESRLFPPPEPLRAE